MLHWINIILGVLLVLFLLGYAFIVICSLVENTGRTIFSVLVGLCHALSPAAFVFAGYACTARRQRPASSGHPLAGWRWCCCMCVS